jgi:hypothetical protein
MLSVNNHKQFKNQQENGPMAQATVKSSVDLDDSTAILKRLAEVNTQTGDVELNARFDRVDAQIKSAEKIVDAQKRDIALGVIKADLDSLIKDSNRDEADFADAANNLDMLVEQIGGEFQKLQQLNPEELKLISDAQAALDSVKSGMLVYNREAKIKLRTDLLAEAKIEAAKLMRTRLRKASLDESIAVFQRRANEAIKILGVRRDNVIQQLKNVSARKAAAYAVLQSAASTIQSLEKQAAGVDADLLNTENELKGLTNGTKAYADQQQIVSDLKEKSTVLNGQVNAAVTIHQSKERFALQLEVHEIAQTKLQHNIEMWIAGLKSDMEERVVTIQSRLDAAKSMSVQEIASDIDKLGAKLDQSSTEYMAQVGKVSDDLRLRRMEAQPERMRALDEVRKGQAKAHHAALDREAKVREEFVSKYGFDPFSGSFLQGDNTKPVQQAESTPA